jgi:hypothetical protein
MKSTLGLVQPAIAHRARARVSGVDLAAVARAKRGWQPQGGANAMIQLKRTYDSPARGDGLRVLVEQLWPRGMKKEPLATDAWM